MTSDDLLVVFLDANVLAKPVTRTLMLRGGDAGYAVTWSETAEAEATRHLTSRQMPVADLRAVVGVSLSRTGTEPERFGRTPAADRQILADAQAAGATFLISEDVDDFAAADLRLAGVSAVNPDLFLSQRIDRDTYRKALTAMVTGMTHPSRTTAQLHAALARQHPRLFARHKDAYDVAPRSTGHSEPAHLFHGLTCLRCLTRLADETDLVEGLCPKCRRQS